jgi:hypothetical protein
MFMGDAIDLVFLGADHVEIPFKIDSLHVSQPCNDLAVEYERRFGFPRKLEQPEGKRVFVIESLENKFHVIAAKMWVFVRAHNPSLSLRPMFENDIHARDDFINKHLKRVVQNLCPLRLPHRKADHQIWINHEVV